jgi:geranylgeranyl pyrophosphate synthase
MAQEYIKFAEKWKPQIEAALDRLLPEENIEPRELHKAMRYATLGGGKRIRAMLVLMSASACGAHEADGLPAGAAIECVHAYSLVHDDLPAMDDDDLRRGKPTCHKEFGEATAILAGDALLTLAFEILSRDYRPESAALLVKMLATEAGAPGMVGGQAIDVLSEGKEISGLDALALVREIHDRKTAALISAAAGMGAIIAHAPKPDRDALYNFGRIVGRAFQAMDDVLDETSTPEQLGKATCKDRARGKFTLPGVMTLEGARAEAAKLSHEALGALVPLGARGGMLVSFTKYLFKREN